MKDQDQVPDPTSWSTHTPNQLPWEAQAGGAVGQPKGRQSAPRKQSMGNRALAPAVRTFLVHRTSGQWVGQEGQANYCFWWFLPFWIRETIISLEESEKK